MINGNRANQRLGDMAPGIRHARVIFDEGCVTPPTGITRWPAASSRLS